LLCFLCLGGVAGGGVWVGVGFLIDFLPFCYFYCLKIVCLFVLNSWRWGEGGHGFLKVFTLIGARELEKGRVVGCLFFLFNF